MMVSYALDSAMTFAVRRPFHASAVIGMSTIDSVAWIGSPETEQTTVGTAFEARKSANNSECFATRLELIAVIAAPESQYAQTVSLPAMVTFVVAEVLPPRSCTGTSVVGS